MRTDADDIGAWIATLPRRISSGELAGRRAIDLGPDAWTLSPELAARFLLDELARLDARGRRRRDDPSIPWRRAALLRRFVRLRALIG